MPWYHYSPLIHLPPILAEGLRLGEVATCHPGTRHNAVSLTTQPDPDRLACWGGAMGQVPDKGAVRYTCRIDPADPKLEPARTTWGRIGVTRRMLERLDPLGQSKWWAFYFGVIPADRFTVELRGRGGYAPVGGGELARAAELVAAERAKYDIAPVELAPWELEFTPRAGSGADGRYFGVEYPADVLDDAGRAK